MCLHIDSIIAKFDGITLSQMDSVKLMNRTDRKYWFHRDQLAEILELVSKDYYILEIANQRNLPYSTIYYDTPQNEMYENHHRGKMNRYKIRRRNYVSTNSSFLEVKFKNNKGRTIKVRQPSNYHNINFDPMDAEFIRETTPYKCEELERALENSFRRMMLVSKGMNERCTIDSDLSFMSGENSAELGELVVVEVKSEGRSHSAIIDALNSKRIKPAGFSKYCIGRSLTNDELKKNNFKQKHRAIKKEINNQINRTQL
ncbi:MAG: polyphosphate polymerase domain-containing protein [Rikenellaceae bacterium]